MHAMRISIRLGGIFIQWSGYLFCLAVCANLLQGMGEDQESQLPNIVLILVDDMGFGDLSCYGQSNLATPHLDRMAKEGMKMVQHYAGSTVCAPSRCVLMSGFHTGHTRVRGNDPALMSDKDMTLARLLKGRGYSTGCFGKWGIGHPPPLDDPQRKGFDEFFGYINMWHAHNCYPEFLIENGRRFELPNHVPDDWDQPADKIGRGVATQKKVFAPDLISQRVSDFIQREHALQNPFFAFYALNLPHANNEGGQAGMEVPDTGEFAFMDWPAPERGFARMIRWIDDSVGRILSQLVVLGIAHNTLVLFTSDNGPHQEGGHKMEFFNSNGSWRGMKRDLFEGGIRVPMIAWWPGSIPAGTTSNHISAFQDYMPTLAELTGSHCPQSDGISFLPTLLGHPELQKSHPWLYWEFHETGGRQAILHQNFKAIRPGHPGASQSPIQLYHLLDDPGESRDVANDNPDIVRSIESILETCRTPYPAGD